MGKRSFPTKTLWNIMEPVSHQAAQLVILHDDACAGHALPDLTAPVNGVVAAVENLLHVCSSLLASSCDPILLKEMPEACHGVDVAGKGLLQSADELRACPTSDAGRGMLAEHVHGLLSSMVSLLFAWDDSEVRHSVSSCQSVLDYLGANLRHVVNEENLRAFITNISSSMTSLLKRVRARADDLISEQRASTLISGCLRFEELWRRLMGVLTAFVDARRNESSSITDCRSRELLATAMVVQGQDIIAALLGVDCSVAERLQQDQSTLQQLRDEAKTWLATVVSGDETTDSRVVWQMIRVARRVAFLCQGEEEHAALIRQADELEELMCQRLFGLRPEAGNWSAAVGEKLDALAAACEAVKDGGEDAVSAGSNGVCGKELLTAVQQYLCGRSSEAIQELLQVIEDSSLNPDEWKVKLEEACRKFGATSDHLARTAERLAMSESRKDIKDRRLDKTDLLALRNTLQALRLETQMVQETCRSMIAHPENLTLQKDLKASSDSWIKCETGLQQIAQKACGVALMEVVEAAAEHSAEEAVACAQKRNMTGGRVEVARVVRMAQWVVNTAKLEAEQHDDQALLARVQEAVEKKTFSAEALSEAGRSMIDAGGDAKSVETWRKETKGALSTMRNLRDTLTKPQAETEAGGAKEIRVEEGKIVEETKEEEVVEEPKFDFPESNSTDDSMMESAQHLHSEASHWESTGNTLVAGAKRLAILMGELHGAARINIKTIMESNENGDRKRLIQTARSLHAETASIVKEAKRIANVCTDKRIKTAMMDLCSRLTTHNQQLKVVTAVKAAATGAHDESGEEDAYEALSTNAQILNRGVIDMLKLAEAASIKIRVDSGIVMRWVRRD